MNSHSRSLAAEVGPKGVRVINVLPGFIATEGAVAHHPAMANERGISLEQLQRELALALKVPMARPGGAEDAAELMAFLASDRAGVDGLLLSRSSSWPSRA